MTLLELMRSRRSIRAFKPDAVPEALLRELIEAAIAAPSASNKQPWRFYVVRDPTRVAALAVAVRAAVGRVADHVDPRFEDAFRAYGDYFVRFEAAPVVIAAIWRPVAVLSHMLGAGVEPRDRGGIEEMETSSGLLSVALAVQNLLLAAHDHGLGASVMTGPLIASPDLREVLGVKSSWRLAALVPLGFPDEAPPSPGRRSAGHVVRWLDSEA